MTRRKVWLAVGVVGVLAGAALTGVVGVRAALGAAEDAAGAHLPLALHGHPVGKLLAAGLQRMRQLHDELGISPEQREQIKAVFQAHRGEIVEIARELRDEQRQLRSVIEAEPMDEAAIRKAAAEMGEVLGDAAVLHAKIRGEVLTKLTPEQLRKVEACRQEIDSHIDNALAAAGNE